jgi:GDP-L-fucose synthase
MNHNAPIYVAGHRGLAGGATMRALARAGYRNVIVRTREELDLENPTATKAFFEEVRPAYVVVAAAKVGGILANNTYPADFLMQNLAVQHNVLSSAFAAGVERLVFLGSSCIYPRDCPQPIKEEYLLTGPLESTNRPYAIAKIAGVEMCWSFNRQHGTHFLAAMPTNLYGPGDNYDLATSHVLPALMTKVDAAMKNRADEVVVWGSGTPRREMLYVDDLADALLFLLALDDDQFKSLTRPEVCPLINIGCGKDVTIAEMAQTIGSVLGFRGKFVFDRSKPDGTFQKLLDVSRMRALGWTSRTSLDEGIWLTYGADFEVK